MANRSLVVEQRFGNSDEVGNREKLETKIDVNVTRINRTINFLTVQKMINRFLTCDRMVMKEVRCLRYTEWELAEKLNIAPKTLKKLKLPWFYKATIRRVILSLVRLYCSTKWVDGEFRDE